MVVRFFCHSKSVKLKIFICTKPYDSKRRERCFFFWSIHCGIFFLLIIKFKFIMFHPPINYQKLITFSKRGIYSSVQCGNVPFGYQSHPLAWGKKLECCMKLNSLMRNGKGDLRFMRLKLPLDVL